MQDGKLENVQHFWRYDAIPIFRCSLKANNSIVYCSPRPNSTYVAFKMSTNLQFNCFRIFRRFQYMLTQQMACKSDQTANAHEKLEYLSVFLQLQEVSCFISSVILSPLRLLSSPLCCVVFARWCYYSCSSLAWRDERSLCLGYYSVESTASIHVLWHSFLCSFQADSGNE